MAKRSKRDRSQPREREDLQETDNDLPNGPYPQVSGESAPSSKFEEMQQWFRRARDQSQKWREEATTCYDFVAGRQWSEEDIAKLEQESRPVVTFNRIGSVADSVMGLEISNRQEVRFIPRQQGAAGVNELLTEAGKWVRDECNAEDEESDAFSDLIICGMGVTETRIDYDEDPDGKLIIDRTDPLEMLWDGSARKRNLMDARHIFRVRQIGIEQAEMMLQDELDEEKINPVDLDAVWARDILTDGMQPHDATIAPYYRVDQAPNIDKRTSLITMVECQWWEHVTRYRVADPMTGKAITLDKAEFKKYKERAETLGIPVISAPMKTRKYSRALLGSKILKEWDGPEKGGFTYKFMTGKRDRNKGTWYGLVRAMMDPQKWANKWLAQVMHIINANAKGGVMAEAGAFENPQEAETTWASPASITIVNDGAIERIKEKPSVEFPAGIDHLMQFAISSIRDVSGVNLELLGMANKDQAGILEHQRKQAGMTILAGFFDALREYRKNQGQLMLYYITNFLSDGRLIRIGGQDQAQYVPLVHTPGLVEYDVIVDQTPTSPNQKEATWVVLTQMMPFLAKMGLPVPVLLDLLECSPLPTALVAKIRQKLDELAKQPKPPNPEIIRAQAEVQKAQIGMQTAQIKGQSDTIKAQADIAKAQGEIIAGQQQGEQAKADVFLTYAQGAKALADAQATQMQPQFSAVELLMGALDQAHQAQLSNRVQDSAEAGQQHDMTMAEKGHELAETSHKDDHKLATKVANKPAARPSA